MKFTNLILAAVLMLGGSLAVAQTNPASGAFGRDPGALSIKATAPAQGAPDTAVNVQLDYTGLPQAGVAVKYRTEGALTILGSASRHMTPDGAGSAQDTVVVRAASAGVYFLNVFATIKGATKVVSVPVTIGSAVLKPRAASSVATPGGERVIEMPAQQTVQ
jgi:hypothetical protein